MQKKILKFNLLIINAKQYLRNELRYSFSSAQTYTLVWKHLRKFMFENGHYDYNDSIGEKFLRFKFGESKWDNLNRNQRTFFNGIKMIGDFQKTNKINFPEKKSKYPLKFEGDIGTIMLEFLKDKEKLNPSRCTYNSYQRSLFTLSAYCNQKGIIKIENIDLALILNFIQDVKLEKTAISILITALRSFIKFLYDKNYINYNYSKKIPSYKLVNQPKLPSNYSEDEIEKLINSINRASSIGKRNYVIVLLAARLGLRASDISRLRFEHLQWETNRIIFQQHKTGKQLILPLLPDIGNAIIDYLKHGRPTSEEPYILLTARAPYGRFTTSNVVTHVVQRAMCKAGINTSGRRFGPHSLRHSLGLRLLEKNTVLPVISEVLGHKDTKSTRYYLRIDLKSLTQCILDVPKVTEGFYNQEGGKFYG